MKPILCLMETHIFDPDICELYCPHALRRPYQVCAACREKRPCQHDVLALRCAIDEIKKERAC